jgi:CheY-like chemotaxis protein
MKRVLHVEDEPDILEVARLALEAVGGLTVEMAESGLVALEKAPAFGPDLILLDGMMPGMDGPATLAELRKNPATAAIPVVFMTAKVQPHEIAHYVALGALGVIAKPFDPMTLADQVRALWERRGDPRP